jgi:hypothetical protein
MRERFDQLAKGILRTVLTTAGEVRTEEEIVSEVQAADVWFVPAAKRGLWTRSDIWPRRPPNFPRFRGGHREQRRAQSHLR